MQNLPLPNPVRRGAFVLAAAALLASGCAGLGTPQTREEIILERAQARWDATLAGKTARAYSYTAPSYRALVSEELYGRQYGGGGSGVSKQGARAHRVYCESDTLCKAVIVLEYQMPFGKNIGADPKVSTTAYEERWVLEDGHWWMLPR